MVVSIKRVFKGTGYDMHQGFGGEQNVMEEPQGGWGERMGTGMVEGWNDTEIGVSWTM